MIFVVEQMMIQDTTDTTTTLLSIINTTVLQCIIQLIYLQPTKLSNHLVPKTIKMDSLNSASIPIMRSPANLMANGPNSDNLAARAVQTHPIDRMQRGEIIM